MIFKPFRINARYYETDRMGIVHHSNYIRWMEEARVDFLSQAGFPYARMEEEGVMIPVLGVSVDYKLNVKFDEPVRIRMSIAEFNGFRLKVSYLIDNPETGAVNALATSSHCFTDSAMKPLRTKVKAPGVYKVFMSCIDRDIYTQGAAE